MAHGKDSVFSIDDTTGNPADITPYVDTVEGLPGSIEMADSSVLGLESHTYEPGLGTGSITVGGPWSAALDAIVGTQAQRKVSRTFAYGPAGSAGGSIKYSGECFISEYSVSSPVGDIVRWSGTLQVSGDVTRGTY